MCKGQIFYLGPKATVFTKSLFVDEEGVLSGLVNMKL